MAEARIPVALRERLGQEATLGLTELLDAEHVQGSDNVLNVAGDRFERHVTQQVSGLRTEVNQLRTDVNRQFVELRADFNQQLTEQVSGVRVDVGSQLSALRVEMHDSQAALRVEMHNNQASLRADLIKWSFLFWVGQFTAMAGLLSYMLRASGR